MADVVRHNPIRDGARGGAGLALAMGLGRFFYTPLLPLMLAAGAVAHRDTAWIATANFIGYFLGSALLARRAGWIGPSLLRASAVVSTLALATMPLWGSVAWFAANRLIGGVASALVFVCVTHSAARLTGTHGHGIVYGGVGGGIVVSGLIAAACGPVLGWDVLWWIAAGVSAILTACIWTWPVEESGDTAESGDARSGGGPDRGSDGERGGAGGSRLAVPVYKLGYFLEGFGYIIAGTYLVVLAEPVLGSGAAALTWIIAGAAAAPSTVVWRGLASRFGALRMLVVAYAIQAVGLLLPVVFGGPVAAIVSAALFGATFMGITMLSIAVGSDAGIPAASATLTSWYSVGQIAGPLVVGVAFAEDVTASFAVAAAAVALGTVATLWSGGRLAAN